MRQVIDPSLSPSLFLGRPESTRIFFYIFKILVPYSWCFIKKIMEAAKLHGEKHKLTKMVPKGFHALPVTTFFSGF